MCTWFYADNKYRPLSTMAQKMMFIIGQGGEGKSRIAIVLREIFGDNMITGNFQRIENDRFFRYNLKDKLLIQAQREAGR